MNALESLQAARKLIEKPENWTKAVYYKDKNGKSTYHEAEGDHAPVCFCAMGALKFASNQQWNGYEFLCRAARVIGGDRTGTVTALNDTSDHATVLSMFDMAIGFAQEMEKA